MINQQLNLSSLYGSTEYGLELIGGFDDQTLRQFALLDDGNYEPRTDEWPPGDWWTLPEAKLEGTDAHLRRVFDEVVGERVTAQWVSVEWVITPATLITSAEFIAVPILFADGWPYVRSVDAIKLLHPTNQERFDRYKMFVTVLGDYMLSKLPPGERN